MTTTYESTSAKKQKTSKSDSSNRYWVWWRRIWLWAIRSRRTRRPRPRNKIEVPDRGRAPNPYWSRPQTTWTRPTLSSASQIVTYFPARNPIMAIQRPSGLTSINLFLRIRRSLKWAIKPKTINRPQNSPIRIRKMVESNRIQKKPTPQNSKRVA